MQFIDSGFTYQQQVMSSPLFYPINIEDGISMGIRSNRLFSHHVGIKGNFSDFIYWIGKLTYIEHIGTYNKPYSVAQKQISGLLEVLYINPNFPIELSIAIAADATNTRGNNLGFRFSISKDW